MYHLASCGLSLRLLLYFSFPLKIKILYETLHACVQMYTDLTYCMRCNVQVTCTCT